MKIERSVNVLWRLVSVTVLGLLAVWFCNWQVPAWFAYLGPEDCPDEEIPCSLRVQFPSDGCFSISVPVSCVAGGGGTSRSKYLKGDCYRLTAYSPWQCSGWHQVSEEDTQVLSTKWLKLCPL
jgi:hypothetical protein